LVTTFLLQVVANARYLKQGLAALKLKLPTIILNFRSVSHLQHSSQVFSVSPFFQSLLMEPIPDHELYYVQVCRQTSLLLKLLAIGDALSQPCPQLREGVTDVLIALGKLNTYV
jgi:hypothetical protein